MESRLFNSCLKPALLILVTCALGACNTNPPRPKPVPLPRTLPEPPPPPPQQSSTHSELSDMNEARSAEQQSYPAPSADAAEVEIEEISLDGDSEASTKTTSTETMQAQRETGGETVRSTQSGGGGGSSPRGAAYEAAEAELASSTGVVLLNPTDTETEKDLIGPNMNIGAKTEAERIARLDSELDGSLAEFDAEMRRARAAAEIDKNQAYGGGGSPAGIKGGRGQRYEAPDERRGEGGAAAGTGIGNTPDLVGETGGGRQHIAAAAPPPNISDGRDDDIVARQLREAATKEADPILREKLWEEYRKYKAGL
ncbi:MAG: hypothetical protein VX929_04955 [Pseudomonadota bacterium]|nr:hypothetical protein [Pseudomonadota bacterium]